MANAEHPDVTAAADRTTVSVDEDGVAVVLEEFRYILELLLLDL